MVIIVFVNFSRISEVFFLNRIYLLSVEWYRIKFKGWNSNKWRISLNINICCKVGDKSKLLLYLNSVLSMKWLWSRSKRLKGLHWGLVVTHLKTEKMETFIFLLPTYLVYQNLFCGTLICPIGLATWFKIGMYLLNGEKHY